ncbi:glucose-6-phosphate dehydrogenase assembly protein OpcA [Virgisporangium aliadipatigenens]|uniref:Glucose-6-phosphate dehydrogenase assembly protein OpcA n=1 Tax=Virgisporangium aliadipatigenens TaxID=741659 RepID=A0A8J3YP28_9ACTN|nr:glucose-6-phosphate dehydrogenase assembly protein OpcA [Virgisporangium aliadipatigenens]GIJ47420.1 glucose-6-phosphate dehydrogenase assembly protein OpcA [Virgisporangium aliadipatigenens]
MIGLWDTTGAAVVNALAAERRTAGGVASGLALTLVAVVDEKRVRDAEAAATIAAAAHPCRILIVARYDVTDTHSRLDAEIVVGGRLGPCEAVVMRMRGRLALHAESVTMPLMAPDVPVVTWWHSEAPELVAHDPLGVFADRRITDATQSKDPIAMLRARADDYAPGDTDLAWTRTTPWRTLIAGAFDAYSQPTRSITITAPDNDPSAALLGGWLKARLGVDPTWVSAPTLAGVRFELADGDAIELAANNGTVQLRRSNLPERSLPLVHRTLGDELAEELRRLDPDQTYASALGAATGRTDLDSRSATRVHIWKDPALAERPEAVVSPA